MHLSMLSPRMMGGGGGGGRGRGSGYPRGFDCELCPKGGDFDHTTYPQDGESDMATILDNEEGLEINLVPKAFPSPGSEGKALETRLPENKSAILKNTQKALK